MLLVIGQKRRIVFSSHSDFKKLNANVIKIHLRKFISKQLLLKLLEHCPELKEISLSKYAAKRLSKEILSVLSNNKIDIIILENKGRPYTEVKITKEGLNVLKRL